MINWHRLFGIFLTDYFSDMPYSVELEKDLSLKQQFLDVVILSKTQENYQTQLPDGLDNLKNHNLLSYKSMQESFDAWAMQELIGHYVNYRKQLGEPLLDEAEFSLYAVSTRFPTSLSKRVNLVEIHNGVYELNLSVPIRLIVLSQIAQAEHNALWHLFSHTRDRVRYARKRYHAKTNLSSAVNLLYKYYQLEGLIMPYTIEEFQKDAAKEMLYYLSADERLKGLSANERLKGLSGSEILKQVPGIMSQLPIEERLKGLSKEEVIAFLQQLESQEASDKH